jgi:hypothetical protein
MLDTALFAEVALLPFARDTFDRAAFMDRRSDILEGQSVMMIDATSVRRLLQQSFPPYRPFWARRVLQAR